MSGFKAWLTQFTQVRGPLGDLARDAAADDDWPDGPDEFATYADYVEGAGAHDDALVALEEAWMRYGARR